MGHVEEHVKKSDEDMAESGKGRMGLNGIGVGSNQGPEKARVHIKIGKSHPALLAMQSWAD